MTAAATLAGHRVTNARVHLPAWGIWWAEASIDEEAELAGRVSLAIADLTLSGTIMSGGIGPKGRASFRLAGGAGGWGRAIPARSYANDAGLKASTVLLDAATACGEAIDPATLPTGRMGPAFVREAAPAARVLEQVAPAAWYVGEDGVTRIGKRPAAALALPAAVSAIDRAVGTVALASDSIAPLVPGITVEGIEAVDVLHELAPGGLRSTLWGSGIATTSRRVAAMRRLFEQLDARRRYRAIYEYRVVTQESERVNLQPIRVSVGMPDLQRVPVRPGVSGARADLALGSRVLVGFIEADPARPVVLAFEDAEGDGFKPTRLDLDASTLITVAAGVLGVARTTDAVIAGGFGGVITGGSTRARCG